MVLFQLMGEEGDSILTVIKEPVGITFPYAVFPILV